MHDLRRIIFEARFRRHIVKWRKETFGTSPACHTKESSSREKVAAIQRDDDEVGSRSEIYRAKDQ